MPSLYARRRTEGEIIEQLRRTLHELAEAPIKRREITT